jgi:hypothetical protein
VVVLLDSRCCACTRRVQQICTQYAHSAGVYSVGKWTLHRREATLQLQTHVSKHQKAHLNIEKATGTAMAKNTKVRKLLAFLCCATMNVLISTICAQENQLTSCKVLSLPTVMVTNAMWQVFMRNKPTSARTTQTTRKGKVTSRRRTTLVVAVPVLDWIGSTYQQNGGN